MTWLARRRYRFRNCDFSTALVAAHRLMAEGEITYARFAMQWGPNDPCTLKTQALFAPWRARREAREWRERE